MNALDWIEATGTADQAFSFRFSLTLLHFLWQGVVIGLLVLVAGWCLRRAASRVRYAINLAAMLLMVACMPVTFALIPASETLEPEIRAAGEAAEVVVAESHGGESSRVERAPDIGLPREKPAEAFAVENDVAIAAVIETGTGRETRPAAPRTEMEISDSSLRVVAPYATAAYLLGVVVMMLRLGVALWGGHRLKRCATVIEDQDLLALIAAQTRRIGMKAAPAVSYCERVGVPVVVGIIKPTILLPSSLATGLGVDQLEAILVHELAHIRRFDLVVNLLQRLVESLLFFHPAVWYVSRRVSIERENWCDDFVVSSGCERFQYAGALIRMAELCSKLGHMGARPQAATLAAAGESHSQFKRRVMRLLDSEPHVRLTRRGTVAVLALLAMLIAAPVAVQSWMNRVVAEERGVDAAKESEEPTAADSSDSKDQAVADDDATQELAGPKTEMDADDIVVAVKELLRREKFAEASDYFAPQLRKSLSAEKLKEVWSGLTSSYGRMREAGPYDSFSDYAETRRFGDAELLVVEVEWEKAELELRFDIDDAERVCGLWIGHVAWAESPEGFPERGYRFGERVRQIAQTNLSLKVEVLDLYGQPIETSYVTLWRALAKDKEAGKDDWQDPATQRTWTPVDAGTIGLHRRNGMPSGGTASLGNLSEGTYRVTARSCDGTGAPFAISEPILVDGSKRKHHVTIRMKPGGDVRFEVVDAADGKPLIGAHSWLDVKPKTLPPHPLLRPRVERNLNTYEHLPAGTYQFSVWHVAMSPDRLEYDLNKGPYAVEVVDGETTQVRVALEGRPLTEKEIESRWPWIAAGTVTDAEGNPIEGVTVRAIGDVFDDTLGSASTDARGKYMFRFHSDHGFHGGQPESGFGPEEVVIAASKRGYTERNLNRHGAQHYWFRLPSPEDDEPDVDPDRLFLPQKPHNTEFMLVPAVDLAVKVLDARGRPEDDAYVRLRGDSSPAAEPYRPQEATNEQGHCVLTDLAPNYAWWFWVCQPTGLVRTPPMTFRSPGKYTAYLQPRVDRTTGLYRFDVVSITDSSGTEVRDRVVGYDAVQSEPTDAALQSKGLAILRKLREVNRYWLGVPPAEVENFKYTFINSKSFHFAAVRDPAKSTFFERRGIAYESTIDQIVRDLDNVIVRGVDIENDRITLAYALKVPARMQLGLGFRGQYDPMSIAVREGTLIIDPRTHTLLEHRSDTLTEKPSEYLKIRDGHYVPLRISVNRYQSDLRFRVHHPGLWLFEAAFHDGNEREPVAYVENVRVNMPAAALPVDD